jgi:hypothetical protein
MRGARTRQGAKSRVRPTGGRHPSAPRSRVVSLAAAIAADPGRVAAALCQMATLAHVSGRSRKRDDSVETAAELLGCRGPLPRLDGGTRVIDSLPS